MTSTHPVVPVKLAAGFIAISSSGYMEINRGFWMLIIGDLNDCVQILINRPVKAGGRLLMADFCLPRSTIYC